MFFRFRFFFDCKKRAVYYQVERGSCGGATPGGWVNVTVGVPRTPMYSTLSIPMFGSLKIVYETEKGESFGLLGRTSVEILR